ncbi:hypothetical protein [Sediminibacterium sp.]|uniref:hypothetical protein n=1 Tax=Sediminibacterium sp. TaxID=1917865 RepID=UPI003F6F7B8E
MTIGEYIRLKAFKVINLLKSDSIKGYLNELENFEMEEAKYAVVEKKLYEFLRRAQDSTPLYKEKKNEYNLNAYPVITKKFISNHLELILSKSYSKQELKKVTTSGSYGTPFSFYLTPAKKRRQSAEAIFYSKKANYEVGICHGYFRTKLSKSKIERWLQNEYFICSKVLGETFYSETRALLKKKKIKVLIGFASAIGMLAEYCIDKGDKPEDFSIYGVLTFAETLTAKQQYNISKAFGCKVVSRYGTEELGILGYLEDREKGFILNTCNYIFEILKLNEDISVLPGETGRVVVTDLHSDALPLIRYETGDLAVLGDVFLENKSWAKSLKSLSGRVIQIINATNGDQLFSSYFEFIIEKYEVVTQYQLVQETAKNFILRIVLKLNFNSEDFSESDLVLDMKKWLGEDAQISIEIVDDIEMLPSGKRPSIINKID